MKYAHKKLFLIPFFLILFSPFLAFSQKDTLINKLDSLSKKTDSLGGQLNNINPKAYNKKTALSVNTYFTLLGSDLKQAFTKPFHMKRKDWLRFGKFAIFTGAMMFADKPIQKFTVEHISNNTAIRNISKNITTFGGVGEIATLTAFGAYGVIFKKSKMVTTTLLATQSYITAAAVENVLKFLSGRTRPSVYYNGEEPKPRFLGPFSKTGTDANGKKLYSSFPSGHTTVVFAAATVFAKEYSDKPLVPILAYSVATLVGISRIIENAHWTTDVIAGAALGYLSGRLVVNNYHRYAKIKAPNQNKGTISFNLNYMQGSIMPGFIYKFK